MFVFKNDGSINKKKVEWGCGVAGGRNLPKTGISSHINSFSVTL